MLQPPSPFSPAGRLAAPGFEVTPEEIQCIENPEVLLTEDPRRILTALRESSVLNLPLAPKLSAAVHAHAVLLPRPPRNPGNGGTPCSVFHAAGAALR